MPDELNENTASLLKELAIQPEEVPNQTTGNAISAMESKETTTGPDVATFQPFELMKLPAEIRRMIFREFLVMPSRIGFHRHGMLDGQVARKFPPFALVEDRPLPPFWPYEWPTIKETEIIRQSGRLKIFLVSKTIYRETVPLYFGHNIFNFDCGDSLGKFLSTIGPDCRWQLARVQCCWMGHCTRAAKILPKCVGLRELSLKITSFSLGCSGLTGPDTRLVGMEDLLRVRGLDKLSIHTFGPCHYTTCPGHQYVDGVRRECPSLTIIKNALEVLKQPHNIKKLKRQEERDFPVKAKRLVYGEANVTTR